MIASMKTAFSFIFVVLMAVLFVQDSSAMHLGGHGGGGGSNIGELLAAGIIVKLLQGHY